MFENPIMFSMLVSIIISLGYFFMNKEKDKKDPRPEKNIKYMILFGVMFIISLIGKICYSGSIDIIEGTIEKVVSANKSGGNSLSNAVTDINTNIEVSAGTSNSVSSTDAPPF